MYYKVFDGSHRISCEPFERNDLVTRFEDIINYISFLCLVTKSARPFNKFLLPNEMIMVTVTNKWETRITMHWCINNDLYELEPKGYLSHFKEDNLSLPYHYKSHQRSFYPNYFIMWPQLLLMYCFDHKNMLHTCYF
jgi:hypothetical protein